MMSFGELLLIALISLLVIGPRRLPETVRFIALQAGRLRQALTQTRKLVEDELGMDDIRRQLHNEQIMRSLKATREEIERAGRGLPPKSRSDDSKEAKDTSEANQTSIADAPPESIDSAPVDAPSSPDGGDPKPDASDRNDAAADGPAADSQPPQPHDRQNS